MINCGMKFCKKKKNIHIVSVNLKHVYGTKLMKCQRKTTLELNFLVLVKFI